MVRDRARPRHSLIVGTVTGQQPELQRMRRTVHRQPAQHRAEFGDLGLVQLDGRAKTKLADRDLLMIQKRNDYETVGHGRAGVLQKWREAECDRKIAVIVGRIPVIA